MKSNRRFVITGGPGVGKSTVIAQLKKKGYQTLPEAYTVLYEKAEKNNKLDKLLADPLKFHHDLINEQLRSESLLDPAKPAFLDRSAVDIIAYGDYRKVDMPKNLREQANRQYDLIFFLDPLPEHFFKKTEIRKETPKESAEIHNLLKEAYKQRGYKNYQLIDVPFDTPENRTQFILDRSMNTHE